MKVVWEERQAAGRSNPGGKTLIALLVKAHSDNESSEQTVIAQLGSIEKRFLRVNIRCTREFHQGLFWKQIEISLDRLDLTSEMKHKIALAVAERIPVPGEEWALWGVTCIPRYDPD
jgi:hypothetical protein